MKTLTNTHRINNNRIHFRIMRMKKQKIKSKSRIIIATLKKTLLQNMHLQQEWGIFP